MKLEWSPGTTGYPHDTDLFRDRAMVAYVRKRDGRYLARRMFDIQEREDVEFDTIEEAQAYLVAIELLEGTD